MAEFKPPFENLDDNVGWFRSETGSMPHVLPSTSDMAQRVRELGFSDVEVNTAVSRLQESKEEINYASLIDMAHLVQNQIIETQSAPSSLACYHGDDATTFNDVTHTPKEAPDVLLPPTDLPPKQRKHLHSENEDMRKIILKKAVEKRKESLRAAIDAMTFTCRLCHCAKATILLLPCGHLASCDDCLMDVRRCPIARCNKIVRGTKEVFFV